MIVMQEPPRETAAAFLSPAPIHTLNAKGAGEPAGNHSLGIR